MATREPDHMLISPVSGNTLPSGLGTEYRFLIDAAGHLQIDIVTMPGSAPATPAYMRIQDGDGLTLANVHDWIGTYAITNDGLVVKAGIHAYDPIGGTGRTLYVLQAISDVAPDLDGYHGLFTHALLSARVNATTTVGIGAQQLAFHGVNKYAIHTAGALYGSVAGNYYPIAAATAVSDVAPNFDGSILLGVHSLLSARKDINTTIGLMGLDATLNALYTAITDGTRTATIDGSNNFQVAIREQNNTAQVGSWGSDVITKVGLYTQAAMYTLKVGSTTKQVVHSQAPYNTITTAASRALVTTSLMHGEDLDVGAGNSEPIKVRTEDGSLPTGEKHHVVVNLHYAKDPTNAHWEPVHTDGSGALMVCTP